MDFYREIHGKRSGGKKEIEPYANGIVPLAFYKGGNMENQIDITYFVVNISLVLVLFFLPAVITKKLFLQKVPPNGKGKALTMIMLGLVTLAISIVVSLVLFGGLPSTKPWATWMVIDYFYLFGKRKKKEVKNAIDYDALYAEMDEFEAEKNGSKPEDTETQSINNSINDDYVI